MLNVQKFSRIYSYFELDSKEGFVMPVLFYVQSAGSQRLDILHLIFRKISDFFNR